MLNLVTFGGLLLESVNEAVAPRLSAQRLAILAVLAAEGDRRVSRERLTGLFWPDADEERARHSLRQALYTLRHEIGREVVRSDFLLGLDPSAVTSDVAAFRAALTRGDRQAAGKLVRGPFLEGFYLPSAAPFQRWAEEERARLHTAATAAIASLASEASAANELDSAIGWWRQLTALDPLSGRFALGYLKALAARGDRAEALAFARSHTALIRRELETEPDAEIQRLEASLRTMATSGAMQGDAAPLGLGDGRAKGGDNATDALARLPSPLVPRDSRARRLTRVALVAGVALAVTAIGRLTIWRPPDSARASGAAPTLAVGIIRADGPDSAHVGRALTDMLSTNLASIPGLQVVANSRLLELIPPGQDTSTAAYSEAARRAGATELLEGRLVDRSSDAFTIEMRRVDLRSGLLKAAYRASATTRFRLVDSVTARVARNLELTEPGVPVPDVTTRSPTAYRLYEEGLRAYYRSDFAVAQQMMRAALDDDSTFAMAAYYDALLTDSPQTTEAMDRALRRSERASERERLLVKAELMTQRLGMPQGVQVAETLAARYPNDARAQETVARARQMAGDWTGAAHAARRAITLDSATRDPRAPCHLCEDLGLLSSIYYWSDSLAAAAEVARAFTQLRPDWPNPWEMKFWTAAKMGDTAGTREAMREYTARSHTPRNPGYEARINLLLDDYENVERDLRPQLESSKRADVTEARWWLLVALRNQGRLRDARKLIDTGRLPGIGPPQIPHSPDDINEGLLALEGGDARAAAASFTRGWQQPLSGTMGPGMVARYHAWRGTLAGMAIAATGDTAAVLRMADTVEYWGQRSVFGRDPKLHHYLRGMVHAAAGRDDEAIRAFRDAIYSPTLGFTRVNFELGRALLRQGRAREAAAAVAPALRGEVDAANLYITRTELHELLAQAYDRAGKPDSAAAHYRTVVRSWEKADERFHARTDAAREWLARYDLRRTSSR